MTTPKYSDVTREKEKQLEEKAGLAAPEGSCSTSTLVITTLERSRLTGREVQYSPNGVVFWIRRKGYKGSKNMQLKETYLYLIWIL